MSEQLKGVLLVWKRGSLQFLLILQSKKVGGSGHGVMVSRLKTAAKALNLTEHITDKGVGESLIDDTALSAEFFMNDIKVTK